MTNNEIIFNEVVMNGIFTEDEAINMIQNYGSLPIHTYTAWQAMGYQVQKGEKAAIKTMLWKPVKDKKASEETGEEKTKMIMVKAALFTFEQVAKIETKAAC